MCDKLKVLGFSKNKILIYYSIYPAWSVCGGGGPICVQAIILDRTTIKEGFIKRIWILTLHMWEAQKIVSFQNFHNWSQILTLWLCPDFFQNTISHSKNGYMSSNYLTFLYLSWRLNRPPALPPQHESNILDRRYAI